MNVCVCKWEEKGRGGEGRGGGHVNSTATLVLIGDSGLKRQFSG